MCNQPTQLPPGQMPVLRVMPMPADLNPLGERRRHQFCMGYADSAIFSAGLDR